MLADNPSSPIGRLVSSVRSLRHHLRLARLPDRSSLTDIPTVIDLLRGRFSGKEKVELRFSHQYAYKFRYLHLGLTELAGDSHIDYRFRFDPSLGRKTAIIRYQYGDTRSITAAIDFSSVTTQLGDPELDFDLIFGDQPRILFKGVFGRAGIRTAPSRPVSEVSQSGHPPPIAHLYHQVLDGGYWPINGTFLDKKWVSVQRHISLPKQYDLFASFTLIPADFGIDPASGNNGPAERVRFLQVAARLKEDLGLRMRIAFRFKHFTSEPTIAPDPATLAQIERFRREHLYDFASYLSMLHVARIQPCPKSPQHDLIRDEPNGHRTYRLLENLSIGKACLSTPVQLPGDVLVPNEHYIAIDYDFANLADTLETYLARPAELERIRQNVLGLYDTHLSPRAIAMHYLTTFRKLQSGEIPMKGWEIPAAVT